MGFTHIVKLQKWAILITTCMFSSTIGCSMVLDLVCLSQQMLFLHCFPIKLHVWLNNCKLHVNIDWTGA